MNISNAGLELIKRFEGFRAHAYPDPATKGEPYTIGYGTTIYPLGTKVKLGDVVSEGEALLCLEHDIKAAEAAVRGALHQVLTDNAFSALVSFVYNLGAGAFHSSTLLREVNAGNMHATAQEFLKWDKANGKTMQGLLTRREAEASLFLS
jgi:lysozyme